MFRLLRNKKVMRWVVGFVAFTFLGGFVGSYALGSLGNSSALSADSNSVANDLEATTLQLEKDLEMYASLIEASADDVDSWIALGDINYDLAAIYSNYYGQDVSSYLGESSAAYQQALSIDSERKNLLLSIAMVETYQGHFDDAKSYYEEFLTLYPKSFDAHALYTQLFFLSGEKETALKWLQMTRDLAQSEEEFDIVNNLELMGE